MTPRDRRLARVAGALAVLAAIAAGAVAVWAVGRSDDPPATTTTTSTTTSSTVPAPSGATAPLTGLPVDAADDRSVLGVKVDQHPGITTFSGIERADIVYEELVEGGITRCLALFQSQDAERVGPVRSLRSSDFDLAASLGEPIIAFSGANRHTLEAASQEPFVTYTPDSSGGSEVFRRDRALRAPHNLFLTTVGVREHATGSGSARTPFAHAGPSDVTPPGLPVAGVHIRFSASTEVLFTWDDERGEWLRRAHGRAHVDDADRQLGVDVVLVVDSLYRHAPWDVRQPELVSVGGGDGLVLWDGQVTAVRWTRAAAAEPFTFTTTDGTPLAIPAGRSWVAFAPPGAATPLGATEVDRLSTGA